MLRLRTENVRRVPADDAPAVSSSWQADLVLDLHFGHNIVRSLLHGVKLEGGDSLLDPLVLFLIVSSILFVRRLLIISTDLFTFVSGYLTLQRFDSSLVKAHIIDHILHDAVYILILLSKGHLERVVEIGTRFGGQS